MSFIDWCYYIILSLFAAASVVAFGNGYFLTGLCYAVLFLIAISVRLFRS